MSHAHTCVWIDHREARVFDIGLEGANEATVREAGPHRHIHRKADHVHGGKDPPDERFLGQVADALGGARAILIAGPGLAKDQLATYLTHRRPEIAARVWGMETLDRRSDGEIVANARRFFRGADRMHG
ncbi:MAG TPA: translational machinery protein [Devosia sp.]|nr:translational machinery protein [Devosia sp.]